jgi:hypothetical protein
MHNPVEIPNCAIATPLRFRMTRACAVKAHMIGVLDHHQNVDFLAGLHTVWAD